MRWVRQVVSGRWVVKGLAVLLGIAIAFGQPKSSVACSCTAWSPEDLLTYPPLIFRGRAIEAHAEPDPLPPEDRTEPRYDHRIHTTFEIQTVWKGHVGKAVTIESRSNSAMCGIQFEVGEVYTVVAGGTEENGYGTSTCTMFLPDNVDAILEGYRSKLQVFDEDLARNPDDLGALRRKIDFLVEYRDFGSAILLLDRSLDLAPDDAHLHLLRAQTLVQLEQSEQALLGFEQVLKAGRNDADARHGLRSVLLKLRRFGDPRLARDYSGLELDSGSFAGWDLAGASFRAAVLSSTSFNHAILARADLREAFLQSNVFVGADLTKANLSATYLYGADLRGADLTLATVRGANLTNANLSGARLSGADFTAANFINANLSGVDFGDASLLGADLRGTDLRGANLSQVDLNFAKLGQMTYDCMTKWPDGFDPNKRGGKPPEEKCPNSSTDVAATGALSTLRRVDLSDLPLSGVSFAGMDLSGANFSGAALGNVDFTGADLTGADFRGATVADAIFLRADLSRADFTGATVRRSIKRAGELQLSFQGAVLDKAIFSNAILQNLDFAGARLSGTVFADASIAEVNFASWEEMPDADLTGAEFRAARFTRVGFSDGQLRAIDLVGVTALCGEIEPAMLEQLIQSGMIARDQVGAECPHAESERLDLRKADLRNTDLSFAWLHNVDLEGADLQGAYLGSLYLPDGSSTAAADFTGANLIGARLRGARYNEKTVWPVGFEPRSAGLVYAMVADPAYGFGYSDPTSAWAPFGSQPPILDLAAVPNMPVPNFPGEDLDGIDWTAAWLPGSRLNGASLRGARLVGVNLTRASLSGANLTGANLSFAVLKHADLSRVSLRGANLRDTDLRGAALIDVDRSTKWPIGFDPIAAGAGKSDY